MTEARREPVATNNRRRAIVRSLARGAVVVAGAYGAYAVVAWSRYGRPESARVARSCDTLLDTFMPAYDVAERHQIRVAAPATMTLAVARDLDLLNSWIVRMIGTARELVLGGRPGDSAVALPHGLLAQLQAIGWGVLAEISGQEVVLGAVTRPWEADVTFRALPAADFAAWHEPGYAKIAVTLRVDTVGPAESIVQTETRVATTDAEARARFRRYWALFSAGIVLLRLIWLRQIKSAAERRAHALGAPS